MPYAAFSGPIPSVNLTMIAYPGSVHFRAGKRTAQRYTYSSYFPPLQYNTTQAAFFGGNFWDSRATGYLLRAPDAEQAQFPPVDPLEMGNSDTACITYKLSLAAYRPLFEQVWGKARSRSTGHPTLRRFATLLEGRSIGGSATPSCSSVRLTAPRSNDVYDQWGAVDQRVREKLDSVSPFTSKFDAYLKGSLPH